MNFRTESFLGWFYPKARPTQVEPSYRDRQEKKRKNSTIVLSVPKAGRTWHRLTLGHYLAMKSGSPDTDALKLHTLCDRLALPRIGYSHGGTAFGEGLPTAHPFMASPELLRGKRVLCLIRDPRDIIVSAFHDARDRRKRWSLGLAEFIRDDIAGIEKILVAYARW
ncbi:MAG: hypothetical protein ABI399_09590, partial [Bauldia sp.]